MSQQMNQNLKETMDIVKKQAALRPMSNEEILLMVDNVYGALNGWDSKAEATNSTHSDQSLHQVHLHTKQSAARLTKGSLTPKGAFRDIFIQALKEHDGAADGQQIKDYINNQMGSRLNKLDKQKLPSSPSELRWHKVVNNLAHSLKKQGVIAGRGDRAWVLMTND